MAVLIPGGAGPVLGEAPPTHGSPGEGVCSGVPLRGVTVLCWGVRATTGDGQTLQTRGGRARCHQSGGHGRTFAVEQGETVTLEKP